MSNGNKLEVQIGGKKIDCLVDTGAAVTVLSHKLFREMRDQIDTCERSISQAVTADGSILTVSDCGEFDLVVGNISLKCKAHVMPQVPHDLILGLDFFQRHHAILDFQKGRVIFKNPQHVLMIERLVIPANSEVRFLAEVDGPIADLTEGELMPDYALSDLGLVAPRCICNATESRIPVLLLNPGDNNITIPTGTVIGTYHPLSTDDVVVTMNTLTEPVHPETDIEALVNINHESLSKSQVEDLKRLISEHKNAFARSKSDVGCTDAVTHNIELIPGQKPCRSAPFRANPIERDIIKNEIDACLENGVIRPSKSAWSSPVVLVKKPDGSHRFCIDYRKLNNATVSDVYPLPRIDDALDTLGMVKPQYFSTLDLQSGYWQVEMNEQSKELTAFTTHYGLYEYNRMPFGLKNAPGTFQRLMESVMSSMNWRQCLVYLDDVIVFSRTFDEHLTHLKEAFQAIEDAGLKLKPSKCFFAKPKIKYLGHIVSKDGIAPCPEKCEAVMNFPTPHDVKSLRSFVGLANYYRKFVHGFGKIAAPLNKLMCKDTPFLWDDECEMAFKKLRDGLCSPPILAYPDFSLPFLLTTDASDGAIGGILGQIQDGKERVIHYTGRSLTPCEKKYSITEKEGLAIVDSLETFDPYLRNSPFTIITDHQALKYIFNEKKNTGSRVARWAMALQQYDYNVVHRAGRVNENADALSRRRYEKVSEESVMPPVWNNMLAIQTRSKSKRYGSPPDPSPSDSHIAKDDEVVSQNHPQEPEITNGDTTDVEDADATSPIETCPLTRLKELQRMDPKCRPLLEYLMHDRLPDDLTAARKIAAEADNYAVVNDVLYHFWFSDGAQKRKDRCYQQVVVPMSLREEVLTAMHDEKTAGHQGFTRTLLNVKCRFYWDCMAADVENWIQSCKTCSSRNRPGKATKAPMILREVEGAFDTIVIDLVGPLKKSKNGNKWILTVEDYLSKWPEAIPLPDSKAHTIATALLDHVISRHSAPRVILSDRGQNFLSSVVRELCNLFDIRKVHSSAYRPQTQGLVERWHSTLYQMLSKYVSADQSDWDELLPMCLFAYRTSHATESTELSPFQIIYGREPKLPIEQMLIPPRDLSSSVQDHIDKIMTKVRIYQTVAKENSAKHHAKMKERYDKTANDIDFLVGDSVWLYVPHTPPGLSRKFIHKWHGPYRIIQKQNDVHYFLRNCSNNKLLPIPVHVNRLKRAHDRTLRPVNEIDVNNIEQIDLCESDLPHDSFQTDDRHDEPDNEFWPIDRLLKGRWKKGLLEYLVKWKGCTSKDNSWVPYHDLNDDCRKFLADNEVPIAGRAPNDTQV